MRRLTIMLLLFVTGCAATPQANQSPETLQVCLSGGIGMNCSGDSSIPVTADRSWIPSDAVIYGIAAPYGFFRFALNQQQPQALGNPVADGMGEMAVSPDKSEVYADAMGPGLLDPHYLYDTKTGGLYDLGGLIRPYSFIFLSPDWHYLAWVNVHDPAVHIVDLRRMTAQAVNVPAPPRPRHVLISAVWLPDGDVLVTSRQGADWAYWRVDPASGAIRTAKREGGVRAYNSLMAPTAIQPQPGPVTTASGTVVIHIGQVLIVRTPDGTQTVVETDIPPASGGSAGGSLSGQMAGKPVVLWAVLDNDVVLYSFGQDFWVYGIAEHKKSQLGLQLTRLVY